MRLLLLLGAHATICAGHGHITWPPNRAGGSKSTAGDCVDGLCAWFSQVSEIPGDPTLPDKYRTLCVNCTGLHDLTRKNPWRAPGAANVRGSGCGVAGGGGPPFDGTGPIVPKGAVYGQDGATFPPVHPATSWKRGSVQEVAWAINANHNG